MAYIEKIFGAPGTGKTYTLVERLQEHLNKNCPFDQTLTVSFTRVAAREIKKRIQERNNKFNDKELHHSVRTIDSYLMNKIREDKDICYPKNYLTEFYQVKKDKEINEDKKRNFYAAMKIIEMGRITLGDGIENILKYYDSGKRTDISRKFIIQVAESYENYKKNHLKMDWEDVKYKGLDPNIKFDHNIVLMIDEAQDCNRLEWLIINKLIAVSPDNYIAGDDDQAIFKWAGADVNSFITLGGEFIKLTQSYRIPAKVHEFAMKIINKVGNRIPKEWRPRTVEGKLSTYSDFRHIDMSKGDWLVLARTRSMLNDLENTIYQNGLYYKNKFKKSYEQDLYEAITEWESWRKGETLDYTRIKRIYSYMDESHANKKSLVLLNKDNFYSLEQCKNKYGLMVDDVWYNAFNNAPSKKVNYIRKMRQNGEQLNKKPRILLSTIHGVKGGEADNVILLTDLSRQTLREYERVPDDVNRLFYVGATRTKEHLHIVEPKDIYKAFRI